ncbi:unnamed protein product [Bemisia tabaci]|uniref:F-box domain-containing protein n=2 Tax=Bemisia tabaci TaxID=7038 RepID=A0A9P0F6E8_BEMTA|nr:unnamed protein product [Bemisia tabaci]
MGEEPPSKMGEELHIHDLPTEILQYIFTLLPAQDLYSSVVVVCERWNCIINSNFLRLKKLHLQFHERGIFGSFPNEKLDYNEINIKTVRYLPYLESAEIYCNDEYHPPFVCRLNDMFQYLSKFRFTLKRLVLNNFKRMPRTNIGLIDKYFESLEQLRLVNCSTLRSVNYNDISLLQNLTTLYLENCFDLTNSFLGHIGMECKKLAVLVISGVRGITNAGLLKFIEHKKTSIQKLGLCCYGISDEGFRRLSECSQLSVLYLEECRKLTWRGLDALNNSKSIELIVINRNGSATNEISYWLEMCRKWRKKKNFELIEEDDQRIPYIIFD